MQKKKRNQPVYTSTTQERMLLSWWLIGVPAFSFSSSSSCSFTPSFSFLLSAPPSAFISKTGPIMSMTWTCYEIVQNPLWELWKQEKRNYIPVQRHLFKHLGHYQWKAGGHRGKCADILPWQLGSHLFLMLVYLLCEVKYKNREDDEEEKLSIINSIVVIFFSSSCFIPQSYRPMKLYCPLTTKQKTKTTTW